jgi:hypothetical protein
LMSLLCWLVTGSRSRSNSTRLQSRLCIFRIYLN